MLSLDTAYRSFGGEVEASSTPMICRLSDSRRHQLSAIAHVITIRTHRQFVSEQSAARFFSNSARVGLACSHERVFEQRPDIGATVSARLAGEPGLKIG